MFSEVYKSIHNMDREELESLYDSLVSDRNRIQKLKDENPHIVALKNDDGLSESDYDIFQSLSVLYAIEGRISVIGKLLLRKDF